MRDRTREATTVISATVAGVFLLCAILLSLTLHAQMPPHKENGSRDLAFERRPQSAQQAVAPPAYHGQMLQDLPNALARLSSLSHVALIAELAEPIPPIAVFPTGSRQEQLNRLVQLAPGYAWEMQGKVVHFYNKDLRRTEYNFLNFRFPQFTVPPTVSDLKLWLLGRAVGLLNGFTAEGGAISGFPDAELDKDKLPRETLENVTPLQVLTHVANESPASTCS